MPITIHALVLRTQTSNDCLRRTGSTPQLKGHNAVASLNAGWPGGSQPPLYRDQAVPSEPDLVVS